jgi:hypothetical protein
MLACLEGANDEQIVWNKKKEVSQSFPPSPSLFCTLVLAYLASLSGTRRRGQPIFPPSPLNFWHLVPTYPASLSGTRRRRSANLSPLSFKFLAPSPGIFCQLVWRQASLSGTRRRRSANLSPLPLMFLHPILACPATQYSSETLNPIPSRYFLSSNCSVTCFCDR